jgi:hypothetical protein
LAPEVTNIIDRHPYLFHNFSLHGLFQAFSRFDETGECAEKASRKLSTPGK